MVNKSSFFCLFPSLFLTSVVEFEHQDNGNICGLNYVKVDFNFSLCTSLHYKSWRAFLIIIYFVPISISHFQYIYNLSDLMVLSVVHCFVKWHIICTLTKHSCVNLDVQRTSGLSRGPSSLQDCIIVVNYTNHQQSTSLDT